MDDEICEAMIIIATIFDVMVLKQGEKKLNFMEPRLQNQKH